MPDFPHVIFDLQHRSVEVLLRDAEVVGTLTLDDAHLVDVDADERPISIEILTLDDLKLDEMADEFGFRDELPAIKAELRRVMTPQTGTSAIAAPMVVQGFSILDPTGAARTARTPEHSDDSPIPPVEITLQRN